MTKLKYSFYHIVYEKKENEFENIFNDIWKQLNIYQRQFELTLKSYKKEWDEELLLRNKNFKEQESNAKKVYKSTFKDNSDNDFAHQFAMNVSGLDYLYESHSIDIDKINNEYQNFLDLYSKSILIALYSLNESKLHNICDIASRLFNKKIKPSHFSNRDYLNSCFQYLNLVIEIDIEKIEKYISKLKDLQFLRNNVIHSDSKFSDPVLTRKIIEKQKDVLILDEIGQLKIKGSKYVKDIFSLLLDFHEDLLWLIDLKQESIIMKNGILHWLGQIDRIIVIEDFLINPSSDKKRVVTFKAVPKKEQIHTFNCKITLTKSTVESFEVINQVENEILKGFLDYEEMVKGIYIKEIFQTFFVNHKMKIDVLIY